MEGAAWDIPSFTVMKSKATQMKELYDVLFTCSLHHENMYVKDWIHYDLRKHIFTQMRMSMVLTKEEIKFVSSFWKRI